MKCRFVLIIVNYCRNFLTLLHNVCLITACIISLVTFLFVQVSVLVSSGGRGVRTH